MDGQRPTSSTILVSPGVLCKQGVGALTRHQGLASADGCVPRFVSGGRVAACRFLARDVPEIQTQVREHARDPQCGFVDGGPSALFMADAAPPGTRAVKCRSCEAGASGGAGAGRQRGDLDGTIPAS
jgi:hypothetical protein